MLCSPPPDAPTTRSLASGESTSRLLEWQPVKYRRAPKPAGGFALLPLEALLLPWLAHEQEIITPLALRGYLACIEIRERRCQVTPETMRCYTTEELRRLLGATVRPRAAAAVRQTLCTTGLVTWPDDGQQLTLCPQRTALSWLDIDRYTALRAAIHPSVQQVPLPRRLLTWLAREGAPGLIATIFGIACRALHYRDHRIIAGGSLVPAWVAATFQIARRTVAYWLHHLQALHWIAPIATSPAHRQAYGPWLAVNLQWAAPAAASTDQNLANAASRCRTNLASTRTNLASLPPPNTSTTLDASIPSAAPCPPHDNPILDTQPIKHHENLRGASALAQGQPPSGTDPATHYASLAPNIQTTLYHDAEARLRQQFPADFVIHPVVLAEVYRLLETSRLPLALRENVCPTLRLHPAARKGSRATPLLTPMPGAPGERPCPPPPPPHTSALQAITPTDLADVARLRVFWQQARERSWVGGSDADWLTVVTAAQHALRVGQNPGGLFVAVLRQQAWHLLTQADEDAARQVLRAAHGPLTASERHVLHQLFGKGQETLTCAPMLPLSLDAQCAREALRLCQTARWQEEPFLAVHAADPTWTRVRWDAACAELEQWQLCQQAVNARQQHARVHAWDTTAARTDTTEAGAAWDDDGP